MKRTAGILKVLATITVFFEVICLVMMGMAEGALAISPKFSELAANGSGAVTVEAENLTPEQMDQLKPIILIILGIAIATVVLTLLGTIKTRTALDECKHERPFSDKSVEALRSSARLEIIGGIVGSLAGIVMSLVSSTLKVNGATVGTSMSSLNLTFLVYACFKYLLYHIADYGRQLERR